MMLVHLITYSTRRLKARFTQATHVN
jgi:hypothetical protein